MPRRPRPDVLWDAPRPSWGVPPNGASPEDSNEQVYAAFLQERKDRGQSDFTPLHLQRVPSLVPTPISLDTPDGLSG